MAETSVNVILERVVIGESVKSLAEQVIHNGSFSDESSVGFIV